MLFDSHAHYDDEKFNDDRDELLKSMRDNNVGYIMNSCSSLADIPNIFALAEKYPFIYLSAGIHPHEVSNVSEADMELLKKACENPKVRAIGEIGLDYFYDNSPRDAQKKWFARQIEIAGELALPIVIHDRDAHKDTMDILHGFDMQKIGGEFHCFAGSKEMAKEVLNMGMYIAFGGSLTFKKSVRPKEVAEYVPLDRMLIETDCPYLTPEPYRSRRNNSIYMKYVVEMLADIKKVPPETIEKVTEENAKRLFNIK